MLRKVAFGIAAVAAMVFAGQAMAQTNPWAPAQTTVPVNINVGEMVELFTSVAPVNLQIVDAGNNQGSTQAVSRVVNHLHNVNVDVSVYIDDDITDYTQFHILIEPVAVWLEPADANTDRTVSWRREAGVYSAASGGFDNQVSSAGIGSGNAVLAFSALANAPVTTGDPDAVKDIQYFADARNVLPPTGSEGFNVVWTIAETP